MYFILEELRKTILDILEIIVKIFENSVEDVLIAISVYDSKTTWFCKYKTNKFSSIRQRIS